MRKLTCTCGGVLALLLATGQVSAQHPLDGAFIRYDKNKDGFVDEVEMAKAFRGPNAKPVADKVGTKESHPDHVFLDAWDADKDGKISRAEFEKYEQKALADVRAAANRNRTYTRAARSNYRTLQRHGGHSRLGHRTNPYLNLLRFQQRAYQLQRQAYSNRIRYGVYSPNLRGGYRGAMSHHRHGRRR